MMEFSFSTDYAYSLNRLTYPKTKKGNETKQWRNNKCLMVNIFDGSSDILLVPGLGANREYKRTMETSEPFTLRTSLAH